MVVKGTATDVMAVKVERPPQTEKEDEIEVRYVLARVVVARRDELTEVQPQRLDVVWVWRRQRPPPIFSSKRTRGRRGAHTASWQPSSWGCNDLQWVP
jgi:hypothetical protein